MHNPFTLLAYAVVLVSVGLACGTINTLASSGSAISLPVLPVNHKHLEGLQPI